MAVCAHVCARKHPATRTNAKHRHQCIAPMIEPSQKEQSSNVLSCSRRMLSSKNSKGDVTTVPDVQAALKAMKRTKRSAKLNEEALRIHMAALAASGQFGSSQRAESAVGSTQHDHASLRYICLQW